MPGSVIVTGGASGLGAAIVSAVQKAGGTPYVLDLKPPAEDVPYLTVDLSNTRAAEEATRALVERAGMVNGVVTAAGMDIPAPLDGISGADWERIVAINLFGTAAVVRAALPALRESHGTIVTVASTLGIKAVGDATAYCASKFGVVGFTRALAAELAGEVNVTLLIPGGMKTAFFDERDDKYKPGPDAPLNDPANTANAVMFALSQPPGCAVREMIVCSEVESSYP
ncbi:SDR family oxidoreductase [Planosporangium flavigriseum]|uniref:Short-chain dehydrogenase n=1 Tax=Planosporangium flavigriseum TaxID=373681 RepID=A0A8J3LRR2_9ACTN|nr:SDR family oxidoreductase [Planosporangium flavigriseum]NJC63405.1 SDR family oxidoreductase [Planosporangium flavigriseum]GIG75388.1 short-chain dehydrogenase [Planosporangium flavigriseum]